MRDPGRIDCIMSLLKRWWLTYPDLRFGQVMAALNFQMGEVTNTDPFYVEDDKLEEILKEMLKNAN